MRLRSRSFLLSAAVHEFFCCFASATLVCQTGTDFATGWARIQEGFDVREGHGRLKNNLNDPSRPPDLLVNVMVEPPGGYFPVVGEIQARR